MTTSDIFFDSSRGSLTRLLSQMDRQPFSRTYGSWCRPFWHQRFLDFSSSACQHGLLTLALLHEIKRPDNPFYKNAENLQWIEASIRYLLKLQHSDGSFDEWYPNERGWAGPTGYLIAALARAWSLVGKQLPSELESDVREACLRSCSFLRRYEETDVLANHQAMALLAIAQTRSTFQIQALSPVYEELLARFQASTCSEGWSLEYDGADPGYQTASLSFLARVHALNSDARIEALVRPMLDFTACFFFGEKSFAGTVGSRGTRNIFHFGFEYWAAKFPEAETLAFHSRRMLETGALLSPMDQEDHYLLYRVPEMLEAYLVAKPEVRAHHPLPCETPGFSRSFPKAGIEARNLESGYFVVNLEKGAALKAISKAGVIIEDSGWVVKVHGALCTNAYIRSDRTKEFSDTRARVDGVGSRLSQPVFNVWSFAFFRMLLKTLGWSPAIARALKRQIRSRIMTSKKADGRVRFTRTLEWTPGGVALTDEIRCAKADPRAQGWSGGMLSTRTVPQSRYFEEQELLQTTAPLAGDDLLNLRKSGQVTIRREFG